MKLSDYVAEQDLGTDTRAWVLAMAAAPASNVDSRGRREIVTAFEARLVELGSPRCRRRLYCQDFIWLVMTAASMSPIEFNAGIHDLVKARGQQAGID